MNAAPLLADLRAAGVELSTDGFRVHCDAAPGVLTAETVDVIRSSKTALIALLDRERFTADPRPDLVDDSGLWSRLLAAAYALDGNESGGVFGALHGFRCSGVRLITDGNRLRLEAGELGDEYPALRRVYLVPHEHAIRSLLAGIAQEEAV